MAGFENSQRRAALNLAVRIGTLVPDEYGEIRVGLRFFRLA